MKKIGISIALAAALVALLAVPVLAGGPPSKTNGMSGKSNVGHVKLVEKDPSDWSILEDGAWGRYNYKLSGAGNQTEVSGVFNGHELVAGEDYSLIYYPEPAPDPWPAGGVEVVVLGDGTANQERDVHIVGKGTIGEPDVMPGTGDYEGELGDKIWLVLTSDLDQNVDGTYNIVSWTPTKYLFETALINTG